MKNDEKANSNYNKSFFVLAGAGIAGIIGSVYYLYNLFGGEEIMVDIESQIEELNRSINRNKTKEISIRSAIKIMSMVTKMTEEKVKRTLPDIDIRRRAAFDNNEEYAKICYEFLNCKEDAFQQASNLILDKINISKEDFQNRLARIEAIELEKRLYEMDKPDFEDGQKLDREKAKKAFVFYGNRFLTEMNGFYNDIFQLKQPPNENEVMFSLAVLKTKCDDELYKTYGVNEIQMRFLLYEYDLNDDQDIKDMHNKLKKYE